MPAPPDTTTHPPKVRCGYRFADELVAGDLIRRTDGFHRICAVIEERSTWSIVLTFADGHIERPFFTTGYRVALEPVPTDQLAPGTAPRTPPPAQVRAEMAEDAPRVFRGPTHGWRRDRAVQARYQERLDCEGGDVA